MIECERHKPFRVLKMKRRLSSSLYAFLLFALATEPAIAQQSLASSIPKESNANTSNLPKQILKTGINLNAAELSPNTLQLANTIGLTPLLEHIQLLRSEQTDGRTTTLDGVIAKQDLYETVQKATLAILQTNLEADFALAEINAEQSLYGEILNTYTNDRDKAITRTNAISFISNGALWAVCESLAIPSYRFSKYAIPSGIVGIPAGVVPSIASLYTLKQINGKKTMSEVEPNMLAKLFGYPTTVEIEYPRSVWEFLNQVPAGDKSSKTRREQLIDRWVADANIHSFTDRKSKKQLDVLTASVAQRKGLSIATLSARQDMLEQLSAEIMKMKRMLLELTMALSGEKHLTAGNK